MLRIIVLLLGGYAALVGLLALLQTRLLFPAWMVPDAPTLPEGAEPLSLQTDDGVTLAGLRLPARAPGAAAAPLLLGFGGNAWSADALVQMLARAAPSHPVAAFHYRGYGPSGGAPSAAALMRDGEQIFDHLAARAPGGIVAVGLSIGTGPAARIAATRAPVGAVFVTPFDSLQAVARDAYPWVPVRLLFRHEMPVAAMLSDSTTPVSLITAGDDTIIPPRRSRALQARLASVVSATTIEGAGHNDLYGDPRFAPALRAAIAALSDAAP